MEFKQPAFGEAHEVIGVAAATLDTTERKRWIYNQLLTVTLMPAACRPNWLE
jgi:hypothetical protein